MFLPTQLVAVLHGVAAQCARGAFSNHVEVQTVLPLHAALATLLHACMLQLHRTSKHLGRVQPDGARLAGFSAHAALGAHAWGTLVSCPR